MTGTSIFLIGSLVLTNVGLLAFLMHDAKRNKSVPEKDDKLDDSKEEVFEKPLIGKSKTRMEDFDDTFRVLQQRLENVTSILDKLEGFTRLRDVEFANPEDKPTPEEIARDDAEETDKPDARMTPEQEAAAFDDVRIQDVDDTVAAPSASGATLDDIEKSMETAADPKATPEEKARAGRILIQLSDTNFMEHFSDDEEILKGVVNCCKQSYRLDIADKNNRPVRITHRKTVIEIADNIDDFDPADLLK